MCLVGLGGAEGRVRDEALSEDTLKRPLISYYVQYK